MLGTSLTDYCGPGDAASGKKCQGYFSGELADVTVWSRELSAEEMAGYTTCQNRYETDTDEAYAQLKLISKVGVKALNNLYSYIQ